MSQKKKIDNYLVFLDKKIGQGSFGSVYIGEQDKTGLKVAVKMLDKKIIDKDEYIKNALLAEISILKTLKNINIVGFLDVMESANYYYIVQEFCDGGDLRNLIKKRGPIPQPEAIQILTEICNGFVSMIREGVIHRDLKPENILIHKNIAKICDFGFSKRENSKKMKHNSIVGTPLYMSLEILKSMPYTSKCDIWALGFIFYELLHGVTPWQATSEYQLIQHIQKLPLEFPKNLSPATKDFLSRCLKPLEKDRISWDELLRHEIFKGYFSSYVNKEHEFENKFKYLMGQIRFKITSQNINLERLFERHGYHKNTELQFQHFQQFMKTIDSSLTPEEQRYIFEKLDTNQSNSISLGEFEAVMVSNNIPMVACYKPPERKISINQGSMQSSSHNEQFQATSMKIINAFNKLAQKMHKNNISLIQVFQAYDVNKDGDITIKQFSRILTKLDSNLNEEEMKFGFSVVDSDHSGKITFREFLEYFCKSTGEPMNDHMSMRMSK